MKSLSFDGLADRYDETRVCDPGCFGAALRSIAAALSPGASPVVLEPGIGTGRVAIPLARLGYHVVGIDISRRMLSGLREQLRQHGVEAPVAFLRADMTWLPFPDSVFDMVVVAYVFYFIGDWKRAVGEILRVVRGDGPIVLISTGSGAEIPCLNEWYKELCGELGSPVPMVGASGTREVVDYLSALGCKSEWLRDRWFWTAHIPLGRALEDIRRRAYSFTTFVPDALHTRVVNMLEAEIVSSFVSMDTTVDVLNQVYLVVVRKP
jgi:ubiquinone/menaquinone biosynthesis C-methylase UbiE